MVRNLSLLAAVAATPLAYAADVHVRVSPEVATGIEGIKEFRTIVQAMDHHPFATTNPDGTPGRVYIEIAPGTYHERVIVTQNHNNITLIGMGAKPEAVVITNVPPANPRPGQAVSARHLPGGPRPLEP